MIAALENIVIKERIRKELTRIPELAADIEKNGLLHPVTVMELDDGNYCLLAGLRRIKAVQSLGFTEIEVKVVAPADAEAALNIEISENEQREDFTYSEKMDYAQVLEEIEQAKALERKSIGGKGGFDEDVSHGTHLEQGRCRDIVGAKIGMSGSSYNRAKYIAENAPPEVIDLLDKGERSIRGVYDELRKKDKAVITELDNSPEESESEAINVPKPCIETSDPKLPSDSPDAKKDPFFQKLIAEEAELNRKRREFDALPPEGKIAELQQQLRKMRERAVIAESDLETHKLNYSISVDHKDSIIDSLKRQNAELREALTEAYKRIEELENGE